MNGSQFLSAVLVIVGGGAGGAVPVTFLARFLGERWLGHVLEKEKAEYATELARLKAGFTQNLEHYRAELDRSIFVTRAYFDTEFNAYREIFAALSDVKNCLHAIRPVFIIAGEEDRVRDEIDLLDRLNKLIEANNRAVVIVDNLRPFYQDEIFKGIQQCFTSSKYEILQVKTGGRSTFGSEWFDDGRKRQEQFSTDYIWVSELIRARIDSLGILPE